MIGILLAAGFSRRFGASNKLLQLLPDGRSIALAAAQNLIQAVPLTIAVLRPDNTQLQNLLTAIGVKVIFCSEQQQTMADSLTFAIRYCSDNIQDDFSTSPAGFLIALADMPYIAPSTITSLAATLNNADIVVPTYQGQRGHPVAFAAKFRSELLALQGDEGARAILKRHAADVRLLPCNDAGILRDIDTPADLMP